MTRMIILVLVAIILGSLYFFLNSPPPTTPTELKTCSVQGGTICSSTQTCSGSLLSASDSDKCCGGICSVTEDNPLLVTLNLHIDPRTLSKEEYEERPPFPTNLTTADYQEKVLNDFIDQTVEPIEWLQQLAEQKGFKIDAQIVGSNAELALETNNTEVFKEFLTNPKYTFGTHMHNDYKDSNSNYDSQSPNDEYKYVWIRSAQTDDANAKRVLKDNLYFINKLYDRMGFNPLDNKIFHGVQVACSDWWACLGYGNNPNPYPNKFEIVAFWGGGFHPYRVDANTGHEDLFSNVITTPGSFDSVLFGINQAHTPEQQDKGEIAYGTMAYQQKYFIETYIEWQYDQIRNENPKPFVFEISTHPFEIMVGAKYNENDAVRIKLAEFYDWLNSNFIGKSVEYANYEDVKVTYLNWEDENPGSLMYSGSQPRNVFVTEKLVDYLKGGLYYFDELKNGFGDRIVAKLKNDKGSVVYLVGPTTSMVPEDLSNILGGSAEVMGLGGTITQTQNLLISSQDAFLIGSKLEQSPGLDGYCGDGVCDDIEMSSGMCSQDCQ